MSDDQPTQRRLYYSARKHGLEPLPLDDIKELFLSEYRYLAREGYFQEALGYECVDAGVVPGTIPDPGIHFFRQLRKRHLWPVENIKLPGPSEEDFFDVIELLHDLVSKGVEGRNHDYGECGWHYQTFDKDAGQQEYRKRLNGFLCEYGNGWELSPDGCVLESAPEGLEDLFADEPPFLQVKNVGDKIKNAITRFRRHGANVEDKKVAVRDLIDAFEHHRSQAEQLLTEKDAADLFHIANRFGIRHNKPDQQTDYDHDVFFEWLFYYYLAALRALELLIAKSSLQSP